jgi:hypothetical protein
MADAFWIGLVLILILLTLGIVRLCDRKEPRR